MERKTITLTSQDNRRLLVLSKVQEGVYTVGEAAILLSLSLRQTKRLLARFRREGAAALAHGNRGRKPRHALAPEVRDRVLNLAQTIYQGLNHQHFAELLAEREGIVVSRPTIRRILTAAGIPGVKKRRPPKHRSRRERMPQFGMLLQIDASHHRWLEDRGPVLVLVGAVDDATGQIVAARFQLREDRAGYFLLLQDVLRHHGIPLALYSDRHRIFTHHDKRLSLEEELAGKPDPTQFGRLTQDLGIQLILARSPQAKGRIERLWETLQDRLVAEMRLAGISSLEEANRFLEGFLPAFNAKFAVPPADPGSAFRPVPETLVYHDVFTFRTKRKVAPDNTVSFQGKVLPIPPGPSRRSYARAAVQVYEHLDGGWSVFYQDRCLARYVSPETLPHTRPKPSRPATMDTAATKAPPDSSPAQPPAQNHPWRSTWSLRRAVELATERTSGDKISERLG